MNNLIAASRKWVTQAQKRIVESNARFLKMSNPEKRVAIAEDVMGMLALEALKAKTGSYVTITKRGRRPFFVPEASMQTLLGDVQKDKIECSVCAIGAAMVSSMRLANQVKVANLLADRDTDVLLLASGQKLHMSFSEESEDMPWNRIFGGTMLRQMERWFEHYVTRCNLISDIHDPTLRLFAIYSAIAKNAGELPNLPQSEMCGMLSPSSRKTYLTGVRQNTERADWIRTVAEYETKLQEAMKKLQSTPTKKG